MSTPFRIGPLPDVMDIAQAASYLQISTDTMYRYAATSYVPAFRLGNRWRFRKALIDAWMEEKTQKAAKP